MTESHADDLDATSTIDGDPQHGAKSRLSAIMSLLIGMALGAFLVFASTWIFQGIVGGASESDAYDDAVRFTVVVRVSNDEEVCWSGSGFVVGDGHHVITNAHVAPGNYGKPPYILSKEPDPSCDVIEIGVIDSIRDEESVWFSASIVEARETLDLSLLKIEGLSNGGLPTAELDESELSLGSEIRVLGYPDFGFDSMVLTEGTVAGFQDRDYGYLYTITAKIGHGNSGGPVLSNAGKVVGVMTLGSPQEFDCVSGFGEDPDAIDCSMRRASLGFAIPIRFAKPLLNLIETD